MNYIYFTRKEGKLIGGIIKASNIFLATFQARKEAFYKGGDVSAITVKNLTLSTI